MDNNVLALQFSATDLYVGGHFAYATNTDGTTVQVNNIAKWDGTNWSALAEGVSTRVWDLVVSGTDLHACGEFLRATNAGPTTLVAPAYAK
jgi:hypothetical protein